MTRMKAPRPSGPFFSPLLFLAVICTFNKTLSTSLSSSDDVNYNSISQSHTETSSNNSLKNIYAFKDDTGSKSSKLVSFFKPTRLTTSRKKSSRDTSEPGLQYPNSVYSCLSQDQQQSIEATQVINKNLSFLALLASLDFSSKSNRSKDCFFQLPISNPLSNIIIPLVSQNITHVQRLSDMISKLLISSPKIDVSSLEALLNPHKTPLLPYLRIVFQSIDTPFSDPAHLTDKVLFDNHQNFFKNSRKNFSKICKGDSERLSVVWDDATYKGLSDEWQLGFSVSILDCSDAKNVALRGFLKQEFSLGFLNIDPCNDIPPSSILYHKCPQNLQQPSTKPLTYQAIETSLKCAAKNDRKHFYADAYVCKCPESQCVRKDASPGAVESWIEGSDLEAQYINSFVHRHYEINNYNNSTFTCTVCANYQSHHSHFNKTCSTDFNVWLRSIPLTLEALTLTVCVALAAAVFKNRKAKMIKSSVWLLLVIIVAGCFLLHIAVVLRYFEATTNLCVLMPWFREMGFVLVYGSLILKVYKILAEFQSRKAHRAQVRDKDLLRGLLVMVVLVVGYMAAWTAVTIDSETVYPNSKNLSGDFNNNWNHYSRNNNRGSYNGDSDDKLDYDMKLKGCGHNSHYEWFLLHWNRVGESMFMICRFAWWDIVIETVEALFLVWGLRLCYRARTAPCIQHEVSFITLVIANELLVSFIFSIIRYLLWLHVHSDYLFVIFFIRAQLTTTPLLCAVLAPKLWYVSKNIDTSSFRVRGFSTSEGPENQEAVKMNSTNNGEVDVNEMRIEDMSADDIRTELKRVYTQLQIFKTKSLRLDNPHISRKKGGKKETHRRFSLQTFHNKHKRNVTTSETVTAEVEASKTPEESTNSAERGSVCLEDGDLNNRKSSIKRHSKSKV